MKFCLSWSNGPLHERPDRTENPDRSGFWYVVRIFGPRFVGPVRGPDFRSEFFPVRYVVRNLVRTVTWSGTWYGFWSGKSVPGRIFFRSGPWSGAKFQKIEKIKGSFQNWKKWKITVPIKIRTGLDQNWNIGLVRSWFLKIEDFTKNINCQFIIWVSGSTSCATKF